MSHGMRQSVVFFCIGKQKMRSSATQLTCSCSAPLFSLISKLKAVVVKPGLFCLFVLMLNVPVNNAPVMSGQSHRFLGITSTFRGVNVSLLKDTTRQRYVSNP